MDFRLQSPYCHNFKIPSQQKALIMQHMIVRKLTRRELEDKYLRLIDENYDLKRENNVQKEKIKVLTTKLLRLTKENSRFKSREFLFLEESQDLNDIDDFFQTNHHHRPVSSSAIQRKSSEEIRFSTPILSARLKSDLSLLENTKGNHSNNKSAESENANSSKNMEANNSNKIKEMENEIEMLHDQLEKLREVEDLERRTNTQLEIQIKELREKLSTNEHQKDLEASVQISELSEKIQELQTNLNDLNETYKRKMDESKIEYDKICELLEKEKTKIKRFEAQSHDFEDSQKMIDELMQQVSKLENEKMEMAKQYEKYATLAEEIIGYKKQINELNEIIQIKEQELENERADKESIQHSQEELLKKMKQLQQDNDELVVKLEGLKSENETLINKNKKLEDRVKVLEDQNTKYLREVNDTLSMPIPIQKDKTATIANAADILKLHEIHEQILAQKSLNSSPEKTFNSFSSSPPNLTVPSVKVKDEKRPSTPEKELRVIPKIVEPTPHGSSHEVSTIPPDSLPSTSKHFSEVFSQSVSKDESVDDEFDPKTFSIDQVSDPEGVSELIEDEEDYEYLFQADN